MIIVDGNAAHKAANSSYGARWAYRLVVPAVPTAYNGKATLKFKPKKSGKLSLKVAKKGFNPATKKLNVRR